MRLALAAAAALAAWAPAASRPAAAAEPAARPNVVLIVVDALRADHLGCYGYGRPTSPRIDAWSKDAVLFEDAESQGTWTLPALSSLMTGLYPSAHGVTKGVEEPGWAQKLERGSFTAPKGSRLPPRLLTLAEALARRGYRTAAFVSGGYCNSAFGFGKGFSEYHDSGVPLEELDRAVLPWLRAHAGRPFFLYLHAGDVHEPYVRRAAGRPSWGAGYSGPADGRTPYFERVQLGQAKPSPADVRHLEDLYDNGVSYEDRHIGALLDELTALGLDGRTLVVLTADHGEGFYEHGSLRHGGTPYQELLRVPLIMRLPGTAGRRVSAPARSVDVFPTVLDALGLPVPAGLQGASLLPLARGGEERPRVVVAESRHAVSLRDGRWKLIRYDDGRPDELYDLEKDPGERENAAAREPDTVARLASAAAEWRRSVSAAGAAAPAAQIDAALRQRLKAEGYLK